MFSKNKSSLFMACAIATMAIFSSCGDDACTQEDWIGTYNLEADHACDDSTTVYPATLVISAGAASTSFSYDGQDITFAECSAMDTTGTFTMELDGDKIALSGLSCEGEYTRQ